MSQIFTTLIMFAVATAALVQFLMSHIHRVTVPGILFAHTLCRNAIVRFKVLWLVAQRKSIYIPILLITYQFKTWLMSCLSILWVYIFIMILHQSLFKTFLLFPVAKLMI
jgi:hypothetical protein